MRIRFFVSLLLAALLAAGGACGAFAAEKRIALVVGEAAYRGRPLPTTANDAGLIAQTLQAAGFDVSGARDLDEEGLRSALRDFVEKASAAGPDTAALIYFAGVGLQLEGENYLLPVNAPIGRDDDIALHAPRLSDYLKPLSALGLKAAVVVVDGGRESPFPLAGQPIAGGLALYEPGPGLLLAYNAAPGTIARDGAGPYGPYAQALAEMIRAGGLSLAQVFEQTRLRVGETTKGAQIPWNSAAINSPFVFFERSGNAPPRPSADADLRGRPIAQLGPQDGFAAAIERDTVPAYQDYIATYPADPMAKRVRAILAARREALFWRRARTIDTPDAYWSYLRRYPHGPHVADAQRLLSLRAAEFAPPPAFQPIDMGYPPPPPEELVYVDRPVLYFDDPGFGFPPPPPPPVYFLAPPPPDFVVLPPPYIVGAAFVLPVPVFVPVPLYVSTPAYIVAPPQNNLIYANIHNHVGFDPGVNSFVVSSPAGQVISSHPLAAVGALGAAAAIGVALPHVIANRPPPGMQPAHGALPGTLPGASPLPTPPAGAMTPGPGGHGLPPGRPAGNAPLATAPVGGPTGPGGHAPTGLGAPTGPGGPAGHVPLAPQHPAALTPPAGHTPLAPGGAGAPPAHAPPPSHPGFAPPPGGPAGPIGHAPPLAPHSSAPPPAPHPAAPPPAPHFAAPPPPAPHPAAPPPAAHFAAPPPPPPHPAPHPAPPPAPHFAAPPPAPHPAAPPPHAPPPHPPQ